MADAEKKKNALVDEMPRDSRGFWQPERGTAPPSVPNAVENIFDIAADTPVVLAVSDDDVCLIEGSDSLENNTLVRPVITHRQMWIKVAIQSRH